MNPLPDDFFDWLQIAKNALNAALSGIETGTAPEQVAGAVVGTVLDEAKSAGLQIAHATHPGLSLSPCPDGKTGRLPIPEAPQGFKKQFRLRSAQRNLSC